MNVKGWHANPKQCSNTDYTFLKFPAETQVLVFVNLKES